MSRTTDAARLLGRQGGLARAATMTPPQRREAARATVRARWIARPVVVAPHYLDDRGERMPAEASEATPWACLGQATTWTAAIGLARQAGYTVPSRRTPGWSWEIERTTVGRDEDGAPVETDAYVVPVLI